MRIAVSGCQSIGKSRFIQDFLKTWSMYKPVKGLYRDVITKENLPTKKNATQDSQDIIMNSIIDEMMLYKKTDNVIYDTSCIDNLVYTMWLAQQENLIVTDKFMEKTLKLTHISLSFLDLIILLPKLEKYQNKNDNTMIIDSDYDDEINNIYLAIQDSYNKTDNTVFPFETVEGSPALIEIFGTPAERIQMVKLYLADDGEPFGKNGRDSLIQLPNIEEQAYIDKLRVQNNAKAKA